MPVELGAGTSDSTVAPLCALPAGLRMHLPRAAALAEVPACCVGT